MHEAVVSLNTGLEDPAIARPADGSWSARCASTPGGWTRSTWSRSPSSAAPCHMAVDRWRTGRDVQLL